MVFSVLVSMAAAKSTIPMTCEAVFIGTSGECTLEGLWMASGTASSEAEAQKRSRSRLSEGIELALQARSIQLAGTLAAAVVEQQRAICPAAVVEQARISCFPSQELTEPKTCFADLPVEECPAVPAVVLEGIGFKVMEKSRQQLCEDVDDALEAAELSQAEQLSCRSRCLVESRVRCR
ncbi:MAG: hypothetical protein P8R54_11560 [Myxococcota bacterium]|nr:hypothetical protein [Myxococcota bacterium]